MFLCPLLWPKSYGAFLGSLEYKLCVCGRKILGLLGHMFLKIMDSVGRRKKVRLLGGALIRCLRQQLFGASTVEQVSRLSQDFLSSATSKERTQREYKNVERSDSKVAGGVMDKIVRF